MWKYFWIPLSLTLTSVGVADDAVLNGNSSQMGASYIVQDAEDGSKSSGAALELNLKGAHAARFDGSPVRLFDFTARLGSEFSIDGQRYGGVSGRGATVKNQSDEYKGPGYLVPWQRVTVFGGEKGTNPGGRGGAFYVGAGVTNNYGYVGLAGQVSRYSMEHKDIADTLAGYRLGLNLIADERFAGILRIAGELSGGILLESDKKHYEGPSNEWRTVRQKDTGAYARAKGLVESKIGNSGYVKGEVVLDKTSYKYVESRYAAGTSEETTTPATIAGTVSAGIVF